MSNEQAKVEPLREFDVVALLQDLPDKGLTSGQVGTVLYVHNQGEAFEVEFFENPREPTLLALQRDQLLKLHGMRVGAA
ncbi:MAG: DUF4926 domain-containing protein [Phycisphaeraceae bacterium]